MPNKAFDNEALKTFVKSGANSNSIDLDFLILDIEKELGRSEC